MSLRLLTFCRYYTGPFPRNQEYFDSHKLVKSIKDEEFRGYVDVRIHDQNYRIEQSNRELALMWFADSMRKLSWSQDLSHYFLCAIPDSACTVSACRPSKVSRLVEAVATELPGINIWDGLRFSRVMPKSSETNMRDLQVLYDAMSVVQSPPGSGEILLIDDVCTTGAHLRAASARIRESEGHCRVAICAARTTLEQSSPALGTLEESLEAFRP
jgi:hypothetical protein